MDIFGRTGVTPGQWDKGIHGKGLAYDAEIARRRAGGRSVRIALTGYEDIDKILRELPAKTVNKMARQSLRKNGKLVLERTKDIANSEIDYGEGVYADSLTLRALRQTKGQRAAFGHQIGMSVMPRRKDYFPKYQERYGKLPNPSPKYNASEPFYVPAALEFGWTDKSGNHHAAIAPQRRALYQSTTEVRANFVADMKQLVNEAGK